jgi:hypothetical protein
LATHSLTQLDVDVGEEFGPLFEKRFGSRTFRQSNGQLMGSLLSFPVLCVINFAIWRHVKELNSGVTCNGLGLGGSSDFCLVNGDDILFAETAEGYSRWCEMVRKVGLIPSAGKNYFSNHFATMNSVPLSYDEDVRGLVPIPWVNQGLLKPPTVDRQMDSGEGTPWSSLGKMHDDFVQGAFHKDRASNCFIHHHRDLLSCTFRNLFGPSHLGGLGATPVNSNHATVIGYTKRQLIVATLLKKGLVSLPSANMNSQFSSTVEDLVSRTYPTVSINWSGPLTDGADFTNKVEKFRSRLLSMFSWLLPLGLDWKETQDFLWLRKALRSVSDWRGLEPLSVEDYLSSPTDFRLIIEDPWFEKHEEKVRNLDDYFLFKDR